MPLEMIISGGQTGADQAGLFAAKKYKIKTGGFAPEGWMTLDGPNKKLLKNRFGLAELKGGGYPQRTWANVIISDGTIRFAVTFNTAGERCTRQAIKYCNKPHFDIDLKKEDDKETEKVAMWIEKNSIHVLNVAGNSEGRKGYTDIHERTYNRMCKILEYLKTKG